MKISNKSINARRIPAHKSYSTFSLGPEADRMILREKKVIGHVVSGLNRTRRNKG